MRFLQLVFICLLTVTALIQSGCSRSAVWEDISAVPAGQNTDLPLTQETVRITEAVSETGSAHSEPLNPETEFHVTVHVCGAVRTPGVYRLPENSRLVDAVHAAGGFLDNADTVWCNQARYVEDQEQILIYTVEETAILAENGEKPEAFSASEASAAAPDGNAKINLNTASSEQLQSLPGIGASRAEAIIAYRTEHGAFSAIEDVMQISGIKESLFGRIKDKIIV